MKNFYGKFKVEENESEEGKDIPEGAIFRDMFRFKSITKEGLPSNFRIYLSKDAILIRYYT